MDLKEGVYTLPVLYALERGAGRRRAPRALLEAGAPEGERLARALELVRADEALGPARQAVTEHVRRAVRAAETLLPASARDALSPSGDVPRRAVRRPAPCSRASPGLPALDPGGRARPGPFVACDGGAGPRAASEQDAGGWRAVDGLCGALTERPGPRGRRAGLPRPLPRRLHEIAAAAPAGRPAGAAAVLLEAKNLVEADFRDAPAPEELEAAPPDPDRGHRGRPASPRRDVARVRLIGRRCRMIGAVNRSRLLPALLAAACSPGVRRRRRQPEPTPPAELAAVVASYDLAADRPARVMVGLLVAPTAGLISYGTVALRSSRTWVAGRPPGPGPRSRVPGPRPRSCRSRATAARRRPPRARSSPPPRRPGASTPPQDVDFGRAGGIWQVDVDAPRSRASARSRPRRPFAVHEDRSVPAPGTEAAPGPRITCRARRGSTWSPSTRGGPGGRAPRPPAAPTTIAGGHRGPPARAGDLLHPRVLREPVLRPGHRRRRPASPSAHQGDAAFIHVEVWKDFQGQVLNRAAADWVGDPTQGEELTRALAVPHRRATGRILAALGQPVRSLEVVEALRLTPRASASPPDGPDSARYAPR